MRKSKFRTLFTACATILLSSAAVIGGTYALWSENVTVNTHLAAGTLKVKLERIGLTKTYLDNDTGYLITPPTDHTIVDFSNGSTANENVFGIASGELVVPGASYSATMRLTNDGSVAFTYDITITLQSVSNELAEQLKVYVSEDDGELADKGYLSSYATNGLAVLSQGTMAKNDNAKIFTVKIVFEHSDENNAAQEQQAKFDLLIEANQKTDAQ